MIGVLNINLAQKMVVKSILKLPDTGETSSYTNTFGEDHDYLINPPGFKVISTGVVKDTITGLMWQQTDGGEMTIDNAANYCDTLTLGGYSDWRLPTAAEGFTILNHQVTNPALNTTVFTKTGAEYWWTSQTQSNDLSKIWCTNAGGGIGNHPKSETISAGGTKKFHVRAVRYDRPTKIIAERFIAVGDSSVYDSLNNLVWQVMPFANQLTWEDALNAAENLVLEGHSDWRLPNIKELRSLNDESVVQPSVNTSVFKNIGVNKYWSSTTLPNQTAKAWYWSTAFGITTYDNKTVANYVLCVRTPDVNNSSTVQNSEINKIKIYPNPANDAFILISKESGKLFIFNALGENLLEKEIKTHSELIDIKEFKKGIYFIKFFRQGKYNSEILIKD